MIWQHINAGGRREGGTTPRGFFCGANNNGNCCYRSLLSNELNVHGNWLSAEKCNLDIVGSRSRPAEVAHGINGCMDRPLCIPHK